jgi:excisionase family DNA binding protein
VSILTVLIADAAPEELAALAEQLAPYLEQRDAEQLLSPEAAAARLQIHVKTLVRAARAGRVVGAIRVGARWRFRAAELDLRPVRAPATTPAPPARPRTGSRKTATATAIRGGQTNRRTV